MYELFEIEARVQKVVIDFEAAMWNAIPKVFPNVIITRCAFHWCQCIWTKIVNVGLKSAYRKDDKIHKYCRKLMALPYLPAEHITAVFHWLATKACTENLIVVTTYIEKTGLGVQFGLPVHGVCLIRLFVRITIWRDGMAC